jgi:hypothetical protein
LRRACPVRERNFRTPICKRYRRNCLYLATDGRLAGSTNRPSGRDSPMITGS